MAKRYDVAEVVRAMAGKSLEEKQKAYRPLLLQQSLDRFREAYLRRVETGERAAYVEAIYALTGVLSNLEESLAMSDAEPAYMWLCDLCRHLEDLDSGVVPPTLDCAERIKGLPTVEWMKRMWVVTAIEHLHATGVKYKTAAERAILGYQLQGVSEQEALSWCKEFRKGHVKNREAAWLYQDSMAWIRTRSAQELQQGIVTLFPET
jgi:hypothetical protein